jgi:hypothetical protein
MPVKLDAPLAVTAIALSMLFIGSLIVYPLNPFSFNSDAEFGEGSTDVTVSSTSPTEYGVCAFETILNTSRNVYIFIDDGYASITGIGFQKKFARGIVRELDLRNYRDGNDLDVKTINAEELKYLLDSGDPAKSNIVFASGAFPVISEGELGNAAAATREKITDWVDRGGIITWVAEKFGYYFAPMDPKYNKWLTDTNQPGTGGPSLFFPGIDGVINPSTTNKYAKERTNAADAISSLHDEITNGILADYAKDNGVLLGYVGDGYSSVSFLYNEDKSGGYLIFGGVIARKSGLLDVTIAQQIAPGLYGAADTDNLFVVKGTMRTDKDVHIPFECSNVYVYTGFIASTYGKLHQSAAAE